MAARLTIVVFLCRITIHRPLQYSGSGLGPNSYHVASYCFFDKKHSSNYNWSRLGGGELGSGLLYFTNNSFQFVSQTELALAVLHLIFSCHQANYVRSELKSAEISGALPCLSGQVQGRVRRDGDKIVSS